MYIKEIHIKSFRHLEDVHLGPFPQPHDSSDMIVLAGPNGGGKSSVLELLGYALSNSWSLSWSQSRSFPNNSFEVAIGLTPNELKLVKDYIDQRPGYFSQEIWDYLVRTTVYYRSYNYLEGEYQKNAHFYNEIHRLVTEALRNTYRRSLGFFLKADRYYPLQGFQRDRLFDYSQKNTLDYIWSMAFNTSDVQYRDMFEFLVQQRYHYFRRLGAYYHSINSQNPVGLECPTDPLKPYDELLQKLFSDYKFADRKEDIPSNLFIELPSKDVIPFSDLSSGEKEVFFILSFFLRNDVTNAIIMVDEPEIHLHPELARLLIQTMKAIKPGNQLWLATHNAEIIDEAGRDRTVYLARNSKTNKIICTKGTDEIEALQQLRSLFGYSGYIGIAKKMVFLEGIDSSSDRKMFSLLFPSEGSLLKFIPCGSFENLTRINAAILSILESNLGWMEFYLIRDRDYLPKDIIQKYGSHSSGRLYVLNRYHIENYLLNEEIIAKVQTEIFGKPIEAEAVNSKLKTIAKNISGEVLRDMVAYRLNLNYRPEDFSLGNFMAGQALVNSYDELDYDRLEQFEKYISAKVEDVNQNLLKRTDAANVNHLITECMKEVHEAISGDSDEWRSLFPGRRMLEEYCKLEGLGKPLVLHNSVIKELSTSTSRIPEELKTVIEKIVQGKRFS